MSEYYTGNRNPTEIEALKKKLWDGPPPDVEKTFGKQAWIVPGTEKPGQTGHYRSAVFKDLDVVVSTDKPQTCYELFNQAAFDVPDSPCLGRIPVLSPIGVTPVVYGNEVTYLTYKEVSDKRLSIGSGLMHLLNSGVLGKDIYQIDTTLPKNLGWGVGIWTANRPEWQLIDLGCHAFSLVTAPLYDTLGPEATEHVTNHSQLKVIFTSAAHLPATCSLLKKCNSVKAVICVDELLPLQAEMSKVVCSEKGVWFGTFSQLEKLGQEHPLAPIPPKANNVATISYTSGTTGTPKGVVLTHRNLTAAGIANSYGRNINIGFTCAGYLPLSHIYERMSEINVFYSRSFICYTTGNTLRLIEDLQLIRPHVIISVPRVLNRIYSAIMAQASVGGVKSALLKRALDVKISNGRATGGFTHSFYDRVVFAKVRALLGGRLNFIGTGSAPLSGDVQEVLRVAFSSEIVQGWGMTETVGSGSRGHPTDIKSLGTIGAPIAGIEMKLMDVPELGYLVTDKPYPRGELVVRGHFVFGGYLNDEKNTKETVDADGFVHTGDVCQVDEAGRFKIIDRKKNIMKLAQGEYVALETVEAALAICPLFLSLFIYGNSFKSHLVAIGVVDPQQAALFLSKELNKNVSPEMVSELLSDKKIKDAFVRQLTAVGKGQKLNGYEIPKGIYLTSVPFPDNLLTPSFKFKRPQLAKHFEKEIEGAYQESEEAGNAAKL